MATTINALPQLPPQNYEESCRVLIREVDGLLEESEALSEECRISTERGRILNEQWESISRQMNADREQFNAHSTQFNAELRNRVNSMPVIILPSLSEIYDLLMWLIFICIDLIRTCFNYLFT